MGMGEITVIAGQVKGLVRGDEAWRKLVLVAVCAVLLGVVGFGIYTGVNTVVQGGEYCANSGATVVVHSGPSGECVGFTDGSFTFDPSLRDIEQKILAENQQVARQESADTVSVVYLLPISSAAGSVMSMTDVVEQLRGAYTAQLYADTPHDVDGNSPFVQLLIGNDGYQADQWRSATTAIEQAVTSQHVVAVAGLGVSLETTQAAASRLTGADIPLIGSTITSDTFDSIQHLVRVSTSNAEGASVAIAFAKARFTRAILVQDLYGGDRYDQTLKNGFEKFADAHHQILHVEPYDTTQRDTAGSAAAEAQAEIDVRDQIGLMANNICSARPAVVLFAGRGSDLGELIGDLGDQHCQATTIISGDDVSNMPLSARTLAALRSDVTLYYAGLANPKEWDGGTGPGLAEGQQGFQIFGEALQAAFPGTSLTSAGTLASLADGNTMMGYDATLTTIAAIHLTRQHQPAPYMVANALGQIHEDYAVHGASGLIAFYITSATGSNPVDKAIPILRLTLSGTAQFVELQWPSERP
jgi:hypothetical protein